MILLYSKAFWVDFGCLSGQEYKLSFLLFVDTVPAARFLFLLYACGMGRTIENF